MLGQCLQTFTSSYGLATSLFLGGLVGGFTHCAGMCSPFVIAQMESGETIARLGSSLLLPYHLGRMTTYVAMAIAFNSLVNLAFLYSSSMKILVAAPLLCLAAVIFLVNAFPQLSAVFPWAHKIRLGGIFSKLAAKSSSFLKDQTIAGRYMLGLLLGFMPCGLVVAALMATTSAPNVVQAGLSMAAFALGTIPALVLVGTGGLALKKKYPQIAQRLSRGAMVISSLWLLALAGMLVYE